LEKHGEEEHGASVCGDPREGNDHPCDDIIREGLEQVCTSASAIPDVVANQVRDKSWVPRVVLGNIRLDLADEICSDVSSFRVDASTDLGEESCEAGPESKANEGVGSLNGR